MISRLMCNLNCTLGGSIEYLVIQPSPTPAKIHVEHHLIRALPSLCPVPDRRVWSILKLSMWSAPRNRSYSVHVDISRRLLRQVKMLSTACREDHCVILCVIQERHREVHPPQRFRFNSMYVSCQYGDVFLCVEAQNVVTRDIYNSRKGVLCR